MILKQAKYKKVNVTIEQLVSKQIFGCDHCKRPLEEDSILELTVFFRNETMRKQETDSDTDKYELCSWKCIAAFLPKIKTDYFIKLPFLHYSSNTHGTSAKDFIKLLNK